MSDVEDKKLAESTPDEPTKAAEASAETPAAKDESTDEPTKENAKVEEDASPVNGDKVSTPVSKSKKSKATTADGNKSASKAAAGKSTEDDAGESYQPGDSVQVKIQGYPWWPAVVSALVHEGFNAC